MNRRPVAPAPIPVRRRAAELAETADLRSAVAASLAAAPINDIALRRDVWMLVGMERGTGASPSQVITTLTDLVDEAAFTTISARHGRLRQVILWCVEAYFGHLGGDVLGRSVAAGPSLPRPASNR
jgi:hypothetical protein